jgi:chromosome partitioning protein
MRKIAVLNQKGGVGKTTTVVNTAAALANMGQRTLVIDLDPQAHLTTHLGVNPDEIQTGSYRVLTQSADVEAEIMLVRPNIWLLPANIDLVGAESELVSVVGRETILGEAIGGLDDKFDYIIIDCAPSLGLLTLNALAAVDEIMIPLQPHFLALQGLGKLLQTVTLVNKRINPALKVKWVLLCMFEARASLPNEVKADIEKFLTTARNTNCAWSEAQILPVYVRRNITLAEAPSYGQTIFEYDPSCHGSEDYKKVAQLIHNQMQTPIAPVENLPPPIKIVEIAQPSPQTPAVNIEIKETQT